VDHYIAFWNLENLFDVYNYPDRSDKLTRTLQSELSGWTQNVLDRKISQLARIIRQMNQGNGPDILGVCEVENEHVLQLLSSSLEDLGRNYQIAHADTSDNRGIDVAFIYDADRFSADQTFSHYIVKKTATRDLFQVNFVSASGNTLILVGNHWPSRSGGQLESEPYRLIAGETLAYFHERIREIHGNNIGVLAMGDFNDEPFNRSINLNAEAKRQRAKVTRAHSAKFLNLMWDLMGDSVGTYYYSGSACLLDQFLASKGILTGNSGFSILQDSTEIIMFPEMVSSGIYPDPVRFGKGSSVNLDGFSDHYPIGVRIREG
jgi:predicted extracellular nuclease